MVKAVTSATGTSPQVAAGGISIDDQPMHEKEKGHYTCLGDSVEDALSHALEIRALTGTGWLDLVGFDHAELGDGPHDPRRRIKRVK